MPRKKTPKGDPPKVRPQTNGKSFNPTNPADAAFLGAIIVTAVAHPADAQRRADLAELLKTTHPALAGAVEATTGPDLLRKCWALADRLGRAPDLFCLEAAFLGLEPKPAVKPAPDTPGESLKDLLEKKARKGQRESGLPFVPWFPPPVVPADDGQPWRTRPPRPQPGDRPRHIPDRPPSMPQVWCFRTLHVPAAPSHVFAGPAPSVHPYPGG